MTGDIDMQNVTDEQFSRIMDFKVKHGAEIVNFRILKLQTNANSLGLGWTNDAAGKLILELVQSLLPEQSSPSVP
jgi:hypothetical protein